MEPEILHGRVVDVYEAEAATTLEIRVGFQTKTYHVPRGSDAATRGALVRITVDGAVELLGRPTASWDPGGDGGRWSSRGPLTRAQNLWARQGIIRAIRDDLVSHGFLEFETPLLVPGGCPDAHLTSFETTDANYLVTSTEYQLKRLVVGGFDRVFSLTKNFRAGDRGRHHSTEFTMVEWARAWETLEAIEEDAERFARKALRAVRPDTPDVVVNGHTVFLDGGRWDRISLQIALKRHLGVSVDDKFSLASMTRGSDDAGLELPESFREDEHLTISFLLGELQPHLGHPVPTFLRDWPAFMTSSAEVRADNPAVANRSELYIAGIEISDGFPFLLDASAQRRTFARENERRRAAGQTQIRVDERYLAALDQGLPPGAGMALGVDRLVMVIVGAASLGEVQPFTDEEL